MGPAPTFPAPVVRMSSPSGVVLAAQRANVGHRVRAARRTREVRLNRQAVRAAEAGLLALFCVFVVFAMFGPGVHFWVGFAFLSAAPVLGLAGVVWAHRSSHAIRRNPYEIGDTYATIGALASWPAFILATGYLGFLSFLFEPLVLLVVFAAGLCGFAFHLEKRLGEDDFRRFLDLAEGTAACGHCRRPVPLAEGRWRTHGWVCPSCYVRPWGVPA